MSQALFQFAYSGYYNLLKYSDHPSNFFLKETWTLSETLTLLAFIKTCGVELDNSFNPIRYTINFNEFYILYRDAIAGGRLQDVKENKFLFVMRMINWLGSDVDKFIRLIMKMRNKDYPLIDQFDLEKNLFAKEAIQYAIDQDIQLPKELLVTLNIGNESYTVEMQEDAANIIRDLLKQSRSEAGKQKYKNIRNFCKDHIENIGLRELESGCRCLHLDLVERIKSEVEDQANSYLRRKDFNNFVDRIDDHIKEAIIVLFYRLDMQYDNVKSRVYRGKYYREYSESQPSPKKCSIHKS